jgi:hypothetical protein
MLDAAALQALQHGRHGDPFAVLGAHADGQGGCWLRALLPGARAVAVVVGVQAIELPRRPGTDLFETQLPSPPAAYRLRVDWADGSQTEHADAYAFGPMLKPTPICAACATATRPAPRNPGRAPGLQAGCGGRALRRLGAERARVSAWWATSTPGTAAATRCGCGMTPGSGRLFVPAVRRG